MCVDHTHWGITTIPKNGMLGVTELSYHFWYDIHTSFFTVFLYELHMNYIPLVCHSVYSCTPVNSSPKKGSVASSSAERESNPLLGMHS